MFHRKKLPLTMHVKIAIDNWPHFVGKIRKLLIARRDSAPNRNHNNNQYEREALTAHSMYSQLQSNFIFSRRLMINDSVIYYFPLNKRSTIS